MSLFNEPPRVSLFQPMDADDPVGLLWIAYAGMSVGPFVLHDDGSVDSATVESAGTNGPVCVFLDRGLRDQVSALGHSELAQYRRRHP